MVVFNFLTNKNIYFNMKKITLWFKRFFSFVKVDYSFLCLMVLAFLLESVKMYFYYVVFIILHELMHLFVAKKLGYFPKKLKLTVFGASLEGFDDFLIWDEIKIVLAGPMLNLFVVVGCYLSFWFYPESFEFLADILAVNKAILLFNILPIFPLDAGRLLLCLFSVKKGRREALKIMKNISLALVCVMFCISIFSFAFVFDFTLGFVSLNLCILLFESSKGTSFKREVVLHKKLERLGKGIEQKVIFIRVGYSKKLLLKFIDGEHYFKFVFVDEKFSKLSEIDEYELLKSLGFI